MNYKVIRSRKRRKSLSLQITPDAGIVVRAPYFATNDEIRRFVEANQGWIERNAARMEKRKEELARNPYGRITEDEIRKLSELAARTIPPKSGCLRSRDRSDLRKDYHKEPEDALGKLLREGKSEF